MRSISPARRTARPTFSAAHGSTAYGPPSPFEVEFSMRRIDDIRKVPRIAALAFMGASGVLAAQAPTGAIAKEPQLRCEQLIKWQVPTKGIGLPTRGATIETAALSAAEDPNGSYCK